MQSKVTPVHLPTIPELEHLAKSELETLYQQLLKADPPPRVRSEFLRRKIAWALQALAQKKKPVTLRKRLVNTATRATTGRSNAPYKPGTRLIREWQG